MGFPAKNFMTVEWQAHTYRDHFSYVGAYGEDLLPLIDLRWARTALDLGCGNGVLTDKLAKLGLEVIGLDASPSQLQLAMESYPHLQFIQGSAENFRLTHRVDLVFSNAVLHWIKEQLHDRLLECVKEALVPKGQFIFECGGEGNNAAIHQALARGFAELGHPYHNPFYFPEAEAYCRRLEAHGFAVDSATTFKRPTPLDQDSGIRGFIRMFLAAPLSELSPLEVPGLLSRVEELLRPQLLQQEVWYADYVRLRVKAHLRGH